MWSLPDINKLNENAAAFYSTLQKIVSSGVKEDGEPVECEHKSDECEGKVYMYEWYDIFSDVPKGFFGLCERHDGYYGNPDEGYFRCDDCQRVFTENYTWELYYHTTEDGEIFCLPCFAEQVINDEDRWIKLTKQNIKALDFEQVRKAPHCIGVQMPIPKGIKFVNNVEFDSMDGSCISGGGVEELKESLENQRKLGKKRAILIMDAAYQFAVSIAIYVDDDEQLQ